MSPGSLSNLTTRPEPRETARDTTYSAPFNAEDLGMVGFPSVHGKGRVWGLESEAQRWDEVIFVIGFSKRKTNREGTAEIRSVTGQTETGLRITPPAA